MLSVWWSKNTAQLKNIRLKITLLFYSHSSISGRNMYVRCTTNPWQSPFLSYILPYSPELLRTFLFAVFILSEWEHRISSPHSSPVSIPPLLVNLHNNRARCSPTHSRKTGMRERPVSTEKGHISFLFCRMCKILNSFSRTWPIIHAPERATLILLLLCIAKWNKNNTPFLYEYETR